MMEDSWSYGPDRGADGGRTGRWTVALVEVTGHGQAVGPEACIARHAGLIDGPEPVPLRGPTRLSTARQAPSRNPVSSIDPPLTTPDQRSA